MHEAIEEIDAMLAAHRPFEHIEADIENRTDLTEDSRDALWLYAWAETDRKERRKAVGELLTGVAHGLG